MNPYDWLNKIYGSYMVAVVGIISRCGLSIDVQHGNQPNESKLVQHKPLLPFKTVAHM